MSSGKERRQHVRVRPTADLAAEVRVAAQPPGMALMIADISLGGIGVWVKRGVGFEPGARVNLRLTLAGHELALEADVRHANEDRTLAGMEFVNLSDDAQKHINRFVSELVERGSMA